MTTPSGTSEVSIGADTRPEDSQRASKTAPSGSQSPSAGKHLPGEVGIWVFIMGDMVVFSLFFAVFLFYRNQDIALFTESQQTLNQTLGVCNTLLLLASSWFVAKGVDVARKNPLAPAPQWFLLAFACGFGFGVVKVVEYSEKISAGHTLMSNDFFMYYFVFTGIHFLHVIIGMVVLLLLWQLTRRPMTGPNDIRSLESGGIFWHLVDLLWIVLFPLLYLVR